MAGGLLGRKLGMTQIYDDAGNCIPVTVLRVGPCAITQKKTQERDGYSAVQIGFETVKAEKRTRPLQGHFKKQGVEPQRHLREFRITDESLFEVGQTLRVALFQPGDHVDVSGTSKGKGFQGVMKRYGHSGGPGAHGSRFHRAPGSIGQCTTPGEVARGTKLPGRMGGAAITTRKLQVVEVRHEENDLLLRGSVPGANNSLIFVRLPDAVFVKRWEEVGKADAAAKEPAQDEPVETDKES